MCVVTRLACASRTARNTTSTANRRMGIAPPRVRLGNGRDKVGVDS